MIFSNTYFPLGPYGDENIRQQVFRAEGAVECDHSSQKRPEHHENMEIPGEKVARYITVSMGIHLLITKHEVVWRKKT